MIKMKKKVNWKHVAITTLSITNLLLIGNLKQTQYDESEWINQTYELGWEIRELENELVSLDEETAEYYSLYKETLNELYMLQVESGLYNESSTDAMRNPMNGKIETMLKNSNY